MLLFLNDYNIIKQEKENRLMQKKTYRYRIEANAKALAQKHVWITYAENMEEAKENYTKNIPDSEIKSVK